MKIPENVFEASENIPSLQNELEYNEELKRKVKIYNLEIDKRLIEIEHLNS